ncbi:hypothetical protein QPK24_07775 [Paenibacillus polygoni]|uniref:Uncharacterized protein n=1 Tax=Paenibacillus polygoni TaxID=3050112 RepID=A0ABY8X4Y0_9BACL|nr:hypothetical protein [Paenibacillus polygoni]WIV20572.1 hypothetical protein QPK24_07775 [Paenibacillus polygoni]
MSKMQIAEKLWNIFLFALLFILFFIAGKYIIFSYVQLDSLLYQNFIEIVYVVVAVMLSRLLSVTALSFERMNSSHH